MAYSDKKKEYNVNYTKTHLKRIPLEVQLYQYDQIKRAADAAGESVNGFIKKAIELRIKQQNDQ